MDDEVLFLNATKDLENGKIDEALWAKALVLAEGDEIKAKYKYILLKVEKLKSNDPNNALSDNKTIDKYKRYIINNTTKIKRSDKTSENFIGKAKDKNKEKNKSKSYDVLINNASQEDNSTYYGYEWWKTWAWLNLTLGNLSLIFVAISLPAFGILYILLLNVLMILILKYNKYAFLIATIISINPVLWIINGIYLKHRWTYKGPIKKVENVVTEQPLIKTKDTEQEKEERIRKITDHYIKSRDLNDNEKNNLFKNLMKTDIFEKANLLIKTYGSFSGVVYSFFNEQIKSNEDDLEDNNTTINFEDNNTEKLIIDNNKIEEERNSQEVQSKLNNDIEELINFYIDANMINPDCIEILRNKLQKKDLFNNTKKLMRTYGNYSKIIELHLRDLCSL